MYSLTRIVPFILGIALSLTLSGCDLSSEAKESEKKKEPTVPVEVAEAFTGPISASYRGTASLEADEDAVVVARVGGVVEELLVEEGARVEAGQVLARLETDRLRLEVARAKANLDKLENEFRRSQSLHKRNLVSSDEFERIKFELQSQRAAYDLAELRLRDSEIRAPFSGIVAERRIKIGNMIGESQPAFRVTRFDPLLAVLHVPEREINKLKVNQVATLTVDAWPGREFNGFVQRISPVVDADSGTVRVTVELRKASEYLKPGMFGRIGVLYDHRPATVLVPRDAVLIEDTESNVFVVADGIAKRRRVVTGYVNSHNIEVTEGLTPGETVITTGHATLKNEAKVEIVPRTAVDQG